MMNDGQPFVIVVAGPNGSGKSSLTQYLKAQSFDFGEYINPDDIAAQLEGSYENKVRQAQTIADERRASAIIARRSFSFETVFSHPSKLDVLDQARSAGFDISLFFVAVDNPIINVERVKTRVFLGGHDVPADRVISRYGRTMALLPEMLVRMDRAWIFDNTATATGSTFHGRLVAAVQAERDGGIRIDIRYPLPGWVLRHVVEPFRQNPSATIKGET